MKSNETQTGSIGRGVGFTMAKDNVTPTTKSYPLGIHTDEHGRTFVQTLSGRIYGTAKNIQK